MRSFFAVLVFALASPFTVADRLDSSGYQVASWSAFWATTSPNRHSNRTNEHWQTVRDTIGKHINVDMLLLQEFDNSATASRIFPDIYTYYFSSRKKHSTLEIDLKRTAIAVKNTLYVTSAWEYYPLDVDGQAYGVDVTVENPNSKNTLRILNVDLKGGCTPPFTGNTNACKILKRQFAEIDRWINNRSLEDTPYVVAGSFGRSLVNETGDVYADLSNTFTTLSAKGDQNVRPIIINDRPSQCWNSRNPEFVDYFIIDPRAEHYLVQDSFKEHQFPERLNVNYRANAKTFSDHCVISFRMDF